MSQNRIDLETMLAMGISQNRAQRALHATQYKGAQDAIEWVFAHEDDPNIDDTFVVQEGNMLGNAPVESAATSQSPAIDDEKTVDDTKGDKSEETPAPVAQSFKCDDCGKLLKNEDEVQYHAAKTEHSNYSESTDAVALLTPEEKQAQLDRLHERLKLRRLEREETEKKEAIQREKNRRLTGRDIVAAKQKFDDNEMKKLAEERRREKLENKRALEKIKAEIEKDRRDREAMMTDATVRATPEPAIAAEPVHKKEYSDCRLQIRLTNGQPLTRTFPKDTPLQTVYNNITDTCPDIAMTFSLMTNFPKRIFTQQDMTKSLHELGLVPSAVLIVSKSTP